MKKIDELYLRPIDRKISRDKEYKKFETQEILNAFALFSNVVWDLGSYVRSNDLKSEELNDIFKIHPLIYEKPISIELQKEKEKELTFFLKQEEKFKNKLKMLRMKGIDPVADIVIKELEKHPSDGVAYEYIRDYAKSLQKALKEDNTLQLRYLSDVDVVKQIYPKFEKYYKLLGQWYSKNPNELNDSRELLSIIAKVCKPILLQAKVVENAKIQERKKVQLEETIKIAKKYDNLKPKNIKDQKVIRQIEDYLTSSLSILEENNIEKIYEILTLDSSVPTRELGAKNSFMQSYPKYCKEYDFNNQLKLLIKKLLSSDKVNWFNCKNNDVYLILPKKDWILKDKIKPRYSSMDALRLVWFNDSKWRIYNTRHDTNKLKYLVEFK